VLDQFFVYIYVKMRTIISNTPTFQFTTHLGQASPFADSICNRSTCLDSGRLNYKLRKPQYSVISFLKNTQNHSITFAKTQLIRPLDFHS